MPIMPIKNSEETVSFGEVVAEAEVFSRHDVIAEDEKNDWEIEEEESENEGEAEEEEEAGAA